MTPEFDSIAVDKKDLRVLENAGVKKDAIARLIHLLACDIRSRDQTHNRSAGKGLSAAEVEILREGGAPGLNDNDEDLSLLRIQAVMQMNLETQKLQADSLDAASVAKLLAITPARVRQLINPSKPGLYHFKCPDGKAWFPGWQFTDDSTIPGLHALLKELNPDVHPVTVYRFMTRINNDLFNEDMDDYLTPRDWLVTRRPMEPVLALIRDL